MSNYYTANTTANTGLANACGAAVAAGVAVVAAVGVAAYVGGRAVVATAAGGAMAIAEAVGSEVEIARALEQARTRGGTASVQRIALNLRDQASATFGATLQERYGKVGRAATLHVADQTGGPREVKMEYAAFTPSDQFLFGLARGEGATLTAYCLGDAGVKALNLAVMDTVEKLAQQILGQQGYRRRVDSAHKYVIYSRGRGPRADRVILWYDHATATLHIDARTFGPDGQLLSGNQCPELTSLLAFLPQHQQQDIVPGGLPLDDPDGAQQAPPYADDDLRTWR